MPVYSYYAIDPSSSKTIEGKIEAKNLREAKEIIRGNGQIPTRLEEEQDMLNIDTMLGSIPGLSKLSNPTLKDLTVFTTQLYTLLDAGIPLIEALFLLEGAVANATMKAAMKKIRTDVIGGDSFSAAIQRYPHIFSRLYINLIKAGEVAGNLDTICLRLAALLEKEMILKSKVQGAMIVPVVSAIVITLVTAGLLIFVVPQFEQMFMGAGADLPIPTQILVASSDFLSAFWWALLIALGGLYFWFDIFRKSKAGKPLIDQWMLTIPVLGDVLNKSYASSFVRTLATLQASGVSLTEGIGTAAATVDNYVVRVALDKGRESILVGGGLSKPLEQSRVFPVMVTKMIGIGEETGNLEGMLFKASDFLDREVDDAVDKLTSMIQPVMTVILGAVLMFILLGLYLPIFEMHKLVGGGH